MQAEALFSDKALKDLADEPAEDCQIQCSTALLTMNPPATDVFCHFFAQLRNQMLLVNRVQLTPTLPSESAR